jgi:hypothetical protein
MWFTREQFAIGNELKTWGLQPRFEVGDVVARGFADLGFEEFQVLPGAKLLSLTAGTSSPLPEDHTHHFFWVPSVDECIELLEQLGATAISCNRVDARQWLVEATVAETVQSSAQRSLHHALLAVLLGTYRECFKRSA